MEQETGLEPTTSSVGSGTSIVNKRDGACGVHFSRSNPIPFSTRYEKQSVNGAGTIHAYVPFRASVEPIPSVRVAAMPAARACRLERPHEAIIVAVVAILQWHPRSKKSARPTWRNCRRPSCNDSFGTPPRRGRNNAASASLLCRSLRISFSRRSSRTCRTARLWLQLWPLTCRARREQRTCWGWPGSSWYGCSMNLKTAVRPWRQRVGQGFQGPCHQGTDETLR